VLQGINQNKRSSLMSPSTTNAIISLPGFRLIEVRHYHGFFEIRAAFDERPPCPVCNCTRVWIRSKKLRRIRHESFGTRPSWLIFEAIKYECLSCGKFFYPRILGVLPYQRSSERFKDEIVKLHHRGIAGSQLAHDYGMGPATIERWYQVHVATKINEYKNRDCPKVMGIDEHFFSRKKGFATTLADLSKHKVFDITLGRSEKSLEGYLNKLRGKSKVKVMLMDLSTTYRSIVTKYFPNALIVADRFHVVRLINYTFLQVWKRFDSSGRYNRGLISLMRRHEWNLKPEQKQKLSSYLNEHVGLAEIYEFKQRLNLLMIQKHHTKHSVKPLIDQFLWMISELLNSPIPELAALGKTLNYWSEPIARMWRFTKTNSILEGLHNKMEMISRRACGFNKFENYRIRVLAHCGG
jgi:transposase